MNNRSIFIPKLPSWCMDDEQGNWTFAEKYGSFVKSTPIKISQRFMDDINRLHRLNDRKVEDDQELARRDATAFNYDLGYQAH